MTTIKTSELTGAALDWAVAKCGGKGIEFENPKDPWLTVDGIVDQPLHSYTPSTDWAQGGPLIERENICLRGVEGGFHAWYHQRPPKMFGTSMLIAAMRCYVASKLGSTVEVPDELINA